MSVADNIRSASLDRAPVLSGGWWLNAQAFPRRRHQKIGQYKIKTRTPDTPISALSAAMFAAHGAGARTRAAMSRC